MKIKDNYRYLIILPVFIQRRGSTKIEEHSLSPGLLKGFPPLLLCQSKHDSPSPGAWFKTFSCNAITLRHFWHRYARVGGACLLGAASGFEETTSAGNPGSAPNFEPSIFSPRL